MNVVLELYRKARILSVFRTETSPGYVWLGSSVSAQVKEIFLART